LEGTSVSSKVKAELKALLAVPIEKRMSNSKKVEQEAAERKKPGNRGASAAIQTLEEERPLLQISESLRISPRYCTLIKPLGSGIFGKVFKMEYKSEIYAFKQFKLPDLSESEVVANSNEIGILCSLDKHPNIVGLLGVSVDPDSMDVNVTHLGVGIMMELCENGSLRQFLDGKVASIEQINQILLDVANGLDYLHQHKPRAIIHCDLKSDNILLDKNMTAKICDFGLSQTIATSASKGHMVGGGGTYPYMSPEALRDDVGVYSDVYSFGCMIYEMLTGMRPWHGLNQAQIMVKVLIDRTPLEFSNDQQDAPPMLVDIMKQCLDYDKTKRPSFLEISLKLNEVQKELKKQKLDELFNGSVGTQSQPSIWFRYS
jgi:serine/threonine protein kinase